VVPFGGIRVKNGKRSMSTTSNRSGPVTDAPGHWNHAGPVEFSPLFDWPPAPRTVLRVLTRRWITLTRSFLFLLLAIGIYHVLLPELSAFSQLSLAWIGPLYLRNVILLTVVAGSLHLYLFTFGGQGRQLKFDARASPGTGPRFAFRDQVHDNMFWSLASGVTVWSAYEVLYLWGAANGVLPMLGFTEHPIAFVVWLALLPLLFSSHFYLIHRLLHWPPMFRYVHRLHHRNVHVGPWSGMSMHPAEHVLYLSSVLVHFVIPSHPVIVLLHLYSRALGPAFSHAGFEKLLAGDREVMDAADFHHQLHHRYFECNYGNVDVPWDRWFGSHHDGSDEATARMRERQRRLQRQRRGQPAA